MQTYEKKADNRTLDSIYHSFSKFERKYFQDELAKKGIPVQSLYRWFHDVKPIPLYRQAIRSILNKMGIIAFDETLFPQLVNHKTHE